MNSKNQLPRKQKNQIIITLDDFDSPLLKFPISFEVFSTKGYMKRFGDSSGVCFKFHDELPCVGAIWYMGGYFESMVHECIHLAHHILTLKVTHIPDCLRESYQDAGHFTFPREEKICQLSGAIINAVYNQHFLKYP